MRKYFLHNGSEQEGPFTKEELRTKKLQAKSQIWYDGLDDWMNLEDVEELKEILPKTPPPINKTNSKPPPVQKPTKKKGGAIKKILLLILLIGVVLIGVTIANNFLNSGSGYDYGNGSGSYEVQKMSIEEIEKQAPTDFLSATGTYKENFWGDKFKVKCKITNKATIATYKDAVVRVTYYSKTETVLGSKDYTIYEVFPPNSTKTKELKIQNYKDVKALGWEVVSAKNK